MKSRIALLAAILLSTALIASAFTFSVATAVDPSYSVNFPSPSNGETINTLTVNGTAPEDSRVTFKGLGFDERLSDAEFVIGYLDYTSTTGIVEISLDKSIRGSFNSMKLTVAEDSFENATLGGLHAREASATSDTKVAYERSTYVGNREYVLFVLFDKPANHTQADADAFFDSFHHTN